VDGAIGVQEQREAEEVERHVARELPGRPVAASVIQAPLA
jgi:hypothetical protein